MIKSISAQLGLLAFAVAVLGGLFAGNSAVTILLRALVAMFIGVAAGQLVGWLVKLALREHLQTRKLRLDREHAEAVRQMTEQPSEPETAPADAR